MGIPEFPTPDDEGPQELQRFGPSFGLCQQFMHLKTAGIVLSLLVWFYHRKLNFCETFSCSVEALHEWLDMNEGDQTKYLNQLQRWGLLTWRWQHSGEVRTISLNIDDILELIDERTNDEEDQEEEDEANGKS